MSQPIGCPYRSHRNDLPTPQNSQSSASKTATNPTTPYMVAAVHAVVGMMRILSLCDLTGSWSKPYRTAGYDVTQIDIVNGADVRLTEFDGPVHGILAAPPCTHFAGSGARWWAGKGMRPVLDGLSIVDACLRAVVIYDPVWWCLENPVGRLTKWLGPPKHRFNPSDYGDPYTKKTCLWGHFNMPIKHPVEATEGSKLWRLPPSPDRAALRSVTPPGFAKAFFEANP